ncbi:MAG: 2-phosphosulfolactate phosphatase, partial [Candidatus Hydrogenedentota bacterium]
MMWRIIPGAAGCAYAAAHGCAAIVVDALRASATAAVLLDRGARELIAVRGVETARQAQAAAPGALLLGERGGLPPEGFDGGNSPRLIPDVKGRLVVFTTTTGAGRLVAASGAPAAAMGSTVNAHAAARWAQEQGRDVVVIPAGLADAPDFRADEDWIAAVAIAMAAGEPVGEGAAEFKAWKALIEEHGTLRLFQQTRNAAGLKALGLGDDVAWCA